MRRNMGFVVKKNRRRLIEVIDIIIGGCVFDLNRNLCR
jgi:hypothetical protein